MTVATRGSMTLAIDTSRPLLLTQGGYAASLSWLIHNFWLYL